jgi:hypothetical protein
VIPLRGVIAGLALRRGQRQEFIEPAERQPEYRDRNDAGVALLLRRALLVAKGAHLHARDGAAL